MEFRLEDNRIFEYVFVFGLAIVILAIVMIFMGTNAQAVVTVDQAGGGDYLTIQEGIDNAIPGENVFVWDGSYNENITIDKSLQLIGNGSATTKIDGFGTMNNIINITAEGVEIAGFNITESGMWYGIWANVGGFNIHDNVFDTQNWAIFMDINTLNSGSTTVGDIIVDNNEVIGTHGFYFNIWLDEPLTGSNFIFGKTVITNNTLHNTTTGIEIDRYTVFNMNQGSITWGDILVKDNFINTSVSFGIHFWGIFWNITDVNIDLGKIDVSDNNLTAQTIGIYIDWWDFCDGVYGNTIATTQDTYIYGNNIVSQSETGIGIILQPGIIGDIIYDSASVTTGDFFIYSNNITTAGIFSEGISVYISETGRDMYNDSSVNFGNIYVDSNIVDSNNNGIYFNYMNCFGTDAYDNAIVTMGDVQVTNNEILSVDHGIYLSLESLGNSMHDQASATLGGFFVNNNNITSVNLGINIQGKNIARNMHNDSTFAMGDFTVNYNTINSTTNMGIDFDMQNSAYNMTGNATVTFGNFLFNDNLINSTDNGIYFYFNKNGYEMYGNSQVYFGHIQLNDNTITCNDSYAILVDYFLDIAFTMEGNSYFEMGNFEIKRNSIESNGSGIYFMEMGDLGRYMSNTSSAVFGDFLIEGNTINASNDGVRINAYDWGEDLFGSASATFGNFSVSNNIIESGYQGIFFQFEPAGYYMYDMAIFEMGSLMVSNNTIISGKDPAATDSYGICFRTRQVGFFMYNESQAIMGPILVNDNTVTVLFGTNADGIKVFWINDYGSRMYDNATFTMNGNIEICRNIVNTTNGDDGIFCDVYNLGYYLYDYSTANYGNFLFNDNNINSAENGIYINGFQMCGSDVYNNSLASFGNIEINGNQIIAGSVPSGYNTGIYFYFYDNGYEMYGNSQVYFGHVQLNDNTITCYDSHGIFVDDFYEIGANYMQDNAYFEIGNFEIQRNWIDANESGIYIWELAMLGYEIYDNSTAVFGDFLFDGNTIYASDNGIYINVYNWATTMTGTTSATFGDFSVSNNIIESQNQGIYFQFERAGSDMHDQARFEMGGIRVMNNTIISGQDPASSDSYGILFRIWDVGYEMNNETQAIVGPILVNDNTVTVLFGTNAQGIYIDWISDFGARMYDTATFTMNGNIEVCRNTVNTTNGDDGIFCDIYNLGNYLYGDNTATYGNFLFNDNIIIDAYNQGINVLVNAIGYYTYGNSSITIGNIELNNNDIQITDGSYYCSIYLYLYDLGSIMYGGSIFNMGHVHMNDNIIYNPDGMGLYIEADRMGYEMYDNSSANFGNLEFLRNDITSKDEGINLWYLDNFAANMYHNATAIFRDFLINDNIINTTGVGADGIHFDHIQYMGYQMNDQSYAQFGNFEVCGNEVNASPLAYGIYIRPQSWAYNMYDNATFIMGDWLINNNTVFSSEYEGIYFYSDGFGYNMYGNSSAHIGKNEIMYNTVNSTGGDGIESWWWNDFGGNMFDYSYFEVGSCYIMFNNITSTSPLHYGLETGPQYTGCYVWDEAEAYFGDYIISNNIIYSNGTEGIDLWYYYIGYWLDNSNLPESRAVVEIGRVMVTDNVITVPNGKGIYIWGYDVAYSVNDYCLVTTGGIHFSRNTINSFGHGIDIYMYELSENNGNNAQVWLGSFVIDDNIITATNGNGIYIYSEFFAYSTYDNVFVSMDDIFITNNDIVAGITGIELTCYRWIELYSNSEARAPGLWITGNNVSAPVSAFNYTTIGTPTRIDPGNTFSSGNVSIENNIFNGGMFGVMIDWQDMLPSGEGQPDFYFENNSIENGSANSIGLYMMNVQNAVIESLYLDSYDQGIYVRNSNIWMMLNSTISNIPSYDLNLTSTSFIGIVNTTFDNASVYFEDNNCLLNVGWFMNVYVQSQVFLPVPDANLTVKDVDGTDIFNGTTNLNGRAFYIICWEYQENKTGIIKNFNDYTADANKAGSFGSAVPNPTMNQTRLVVIILTDLIPPTIFSDNSDTAGTTGDPFYFEINATDNMGIVSVHVNYRLGGVGPYTNLTMSGTGPYWLNEILPSDYVGFIEYYFTAVDFGGFWVNTTPTTAPITDNDPPTIISDNSDALATTGETFNFIVDATDNINMSEVHVVWWFGAGAPTNDTMIGTGPYTFSIPVPPDSLDQLHYYFTMNDTEGNWLVGPLVDINVTDNDAPPYTWVSQPSAGTTGDSVLVSILATDNVGVTYYKIDVDGTLYDLVKNGNYYNFTINIPPDSLTNITYFAVFNDSANNPNGTATTVITITDNDTPTYNWVLQPTVGVAGTSVDVSLQAFDNIGITNYTIYINGTPYDMVKDGDYYNYTINIPPGSTLDIAYNVTFRDAEGNSIETGNTMITVIPTDTEAPILTWVSQPTAGTTGESVLVSIIASDNIGVTYSKIDIDGTLYDLINDSDYYNFTIDIPVDSIADITYSLIFNDSANNQNSTAPTVVTVTDNDAPQYIWISQPTAGTTSELLLVSIQATDNIGVIYYKIDIDGTLYDMVKDGNFYNYTINIPSDSISDITYGIILNDNANNQNTIPGTVVTVTDNKEPTYVWILQPTAGTAGDSVVVSLMALDNVGITNYTIIIDSVSYAMVKDGDYYNFTIVLPTDGTTSVTYNITFMDGALNTNTTADIVITISPVDDEAPVHIWVLHPDTGTTGESILISLVATDNVVITTYQINIDGTLHDLVKDGDYYNYTFIILSDRTTDITYFVVFNDDANNLNTVPDTTVTITDNDGPTNLVNTSDITATTGNTFIFEVNASDNIGIDEVHVVYWFGTGTPVNATMTGTGPYNLDITIPSDSLDTLHYYFAITDAADNWLVGIQVDISITDNEQATVSNEASDESGKEGEAFTFQIDASDNVGIFQVRVAYWFGDDESQKQFITLTATDGTYSGSFTPDQSGTMNYYFEVTDSAGNTIESDDYTANVASEPEEEEDGLNPLLIILPIIVIIILLLLFLLMRKKKEEEVPPEMAEGEEEVAAEELEEGEEFEEEGMGPEEELEEGEEIEGFEEGEEESGAEPEEEFEEEPAEETESGDTADEKPDEGESEEQPDEEPEEKKSDELDDILNGL